ncbi:MAG: hypothetical protein ABW154_09930 [Dyella sp.]
MKLSARSTVLHTATLSGLLLLSACGKQADQQQTAAPAASTTPAVTPAANGSIAPAAPVSAPAAASTAATAMTPPTAAPAAAPAAATDSIKVDTVVLGAAIGTDHKVSKPKTSFDASEKALYASVSTQGSSAGTTLSAKWSYLEGQGVTVADTSQSIAPDGSAVTTFSVRNPNEWPEGKYKVEISLDNKLVSTQNFDIKKR